MLKLRMPLINKCLFVRMVFNNFKPLGLFHDKINILGLIACDKLENVLFGQNYKNIHIFQINENDIVCQFKAPEFTRL